MIAPVGPAQGFRSYGGGGCGDALTTTLGYVQRRVALHDITNRV